MQRLFYHQFRGVKQLESIPKSLRISLQSEDHVHGFQLNPKCLNQFTAQTKSFANDSSFPEYAPLKINTFSFIRSSNLVSGTGHIQLGVRPAKRPYSHHFFVRITLIDWTWSKNFCPAVFSCGISYPRKGFCRLAMVKG